MHAKRRGALEKMVVSAATGGILTVTGLGRTMRSAAKEKHCIKCSDRLLSNSHLQSQRLEVYRSISSKILESVRSPVIIIDWSDLNKRHGLYLLRASVAVDSRALTLYEEVHDISTKEKPRTHRLFLANLKAILPTDVSAIVVTDAGFRGPWFREIEKLGWDWVGRVRNKTLVQMEDETGWKPCKSLYEDATRRPKSLGNATLTRSNPLECKLVVYKGKAKGRLKTNLANCRAQAISSKKHSAREREPWLLATSLKLSSHHARRVVKLYATRMQIEEAFRDLKSARCGSSFEYSNTRIRARLEILLLIGSLANLLLWLLGRAIQLSKQHRQYQANSVTTKNILSPIFLGRRIAQDKRVKIYYSQIEKALQDCRKIMQTHAHGY
jgi:hypothetical protein